MKRYTNSHKRILTPLVIILVLISFKVSYSSEFITRSIEEHIHEATLIIKGKLTKKFSKKESFGNHVNKIFTTYVFSVQEVLKGKYIKSTISVKMFGGCDEVSGDCASYSFAYNYKIDDMAVLFLDYFKNSEVYKVTQSANTAFAIDKKNNLFRKSESEIKNSSNILTNKNKKLVYKQNLNLNTLKEIIQEKEK